MIEQIKILVSRRAYEFRPDDLRLTVLTTAEVSQQIQDHFSFQVLQVATPLQTFGPIPITMPPGLVFDYGTTQTPEYEPAPIRFLHFEPQRIVVDVAGPSSAIDWTFERLRLILEDVRAPDGSPAIGEPASIKEYSEISARYSFGIEDVIGGPLLDLASETFGGEELTVMPLGIKFGAVDPSAAVHPSEIGSMAFSRGSFVELRAGTTPEDKTFFSAAELTTDEHRSWLEALDQRMSGTEGASGG